VSSAAGGRPGNADLLFTVLGPVGFVLAGEHHSVVRAQTRGQLALFCLRAGRAVSFEAVEEAIWGGAAPTTARGQVHAAVHAIRGRLASAGAPEVLAGGAFGYRLEVSSEQVDAGMFDACVRRAREAGRAGRAADAVGAGSVAGRSVGGRVRRLWSKAPARLWSSAGSPSWKNSRTRSWLRRKVRPQHPRGVHRPTAALR
jgi:hypothetical protein